MGGSFLQEVMSKQKPGDKWDSWTTGGWETLLGRGERVGRPRGKAARLRRGHLCGGVDTGAGIRLRSKRNREPQRLCVFVFGFVFCIQYKAPVLTVHGAKFWQMRKRHHSPNARRSRRPRCSLVSPPPGAAPPPSQAPADLLVCAGQTCFFWNFGHRMDTLVTGRSLSAR